VASARTVGEAGTDTGARLLMGGEPWTCRPPPVPPDVRETATRAITIATTTPTVPKAIVDDEKRRGVPRPLGRAVPARP
jgi:hypothetical protein